MGTAAPGLRQDRDADQAAGPEGDQPPRTRTERRGQGRGEGRAVSTSPLPGLCRCRTGCVCVFRVCLVCDKNQFVFVAAVSLLLVASVCEWLIDLHAGCTHVSVCLCVSRW